MRPANLLGTCPSLNIEFPHLAFAVGFLDVRISYHTRGGLLYESQLRLSFVERTKSVGTSIVLKVNPPR